ncbi:unnamed protein product [Zymoseptoria tritici ST99CH_1A5]|uniref:Uncharacterized protein n=2 Tax=Zymoseptoria tritici TaxID=1047171 RepID=A0A1X7RN65_ZYMT9|nr:unnamed protein product [Zymoseptoria tritici ST99CH_3D7]SMR49446.1 unnamed protein product [Zymoseptoria tritici ST99CH_3D1]SMY22143.1 unnamed protein product [Zymoseptoria tritici ST99CH_1A5]
MPRRPQKELAAFQQSAGSATEPRSDETDDIELHLNSLPSTYGCSAGAADRGGHFDAGGLVKIGAWLGDLSDETMSVNGMLSFAEVKKSHFDQITAGADPNEVEPHVLAKPQLPVTMLLQCKACGNGQPLQANVFIFRWIDPATEKEMLNHVWTLAAWLGPPNARREVFALLEKVPTDEAGLNESTDPLWRFWKSGGGYTNETTLAASEPGIFSKRALSRMRVQQPDAENEWDKEDPLRGRKESWRAKRKRAGNGSKSRTTPSSSSRGKKRSRGHGRNDPVVDTCSSIDDRDPDDSEGYHIPAKRLIRLLEQFGSVRDDSHDGSLSLRRDSRTTPSSATREPRSARTSTVGPQSPRR